MKIKNKILPPKTGIDFLASSHFNIGNDPQWNKANKSTFQTAYFPKITKSHGPIKMQPPANIMHKDERVLDSCFSVTREQFIKKNIAKEDYHHRSLTKTNFKMDSDDRIDTFRTTHDSYYTTPLLNKTAIKHMSPQMKSYIPQGDIEKENLPQSDYKNNFQKIALPVKQANAYKRSNPIQGDERSHQNMFNTSNRDIFHGHLNHKKITFPLSLKYPRTEIPHGDPEPLESTQQCSFKTKPISYGFNRDKELSEFQKTSIQNGDNRMNSYETTNQTYTSFQAVTREGLQMLKANKLGRSHIPEGDMEPSRLHERVTTVNRTDFEKPPSSYRNQRVDGSKIRATSNVTFGSDRENYFQTIFETSFPFKSTQFKKNTVNICSSSIPLKFYENLVSDSSYRTDFHSTKNSKKFMPSPKALDNIRGSHIGERLESLNLFNTTHSDTYTPKPCTPLKPIDIGKLQKSSVPIGTMQS